MITSSSAGGLDVFSGAFFTTLMEMGMELADGFDLFELVLSWDEVGLEIFCCT